MAPPTRSIVMKRVCWYREMAVYILIVCIHFLVVWEDMVLILKLTKPHPKHTLKSIHTTTRTIALCNVIKYNTYTHNSAGVEQVQHCRVELLLLIVGVHDDARRDDQRGHRRH